MTVDVTKPMEVVTLKGAEEPEGTVWDAEFWRFDEDGDIWVRKLLPAHHFKPSGTHYYGAPYRLRNKG